MLCYKCMICFHPKILLIFRTVGANCYTVHVTLAIAHWFTLNLKHAHFYFNSCLLAHLNFFQAINAYCAQFHSRNVKSEFNNRHDIKRRCGKRLQRNAKLQWNTLMRYIKWVVFHKSINKFVVETKLIRKCTWIVLARKLRFYEWSRLHLEA